jgi:FG-GAP repeat/Divergent InlB B-repeat domain
MKSEVVKTALVIGVSMLLAACGGGSSTSESGGTSPANTTTITSGTFVDSSVDGLPYSTSSNPAGGITGGGGHFQCQPGDTVRFFLGARQIGNAQPCSSDTVTVVSVLGAASVTDPQVVNLTQLLLTLATSVTPSVMTLPQPLPAGFNSARVPPFTDPNFDTDVLAALPPGTILATTTAATTHLQASLKMLSVTIANGGTVTSTPVGINCVSGVGICSFVFQTNAVVTLTATGTGFTGWSGGDCSGTDVCVVMMNADTMVTATFPAAPPPATLTISTTGGTGTGTVTCSANGGAFAVCAASYPNGTALVLQGVGNSGSTFTSWTNGAGNATVCNGATGNCSMTLNANTTVTAVFALNAVTQFSVTAMTATGNGGGGTVLCSANGGAMGPCGNYAVGTSISITPTPNSASNFTNWTNGTGSVSANCGNATGACTFTLTGNTSITANFNLPMLNVVLAGTGVGTVTSTNIAGINCGATCTAPFNKGATVTLAAAGDGFSGWSGDGCSGSGTCMVTVNADSTIIATFNTGLPPFAQQAYIKASNTDAWDFFGESLALEGDTLVVGAEGEASRATGVNGNQADNSAPNSGAVYVFTRTNGVWTQQAYLKASNTGAGDSFGFEIALSGDTLAVGAPGEASSATGVNGKQADNSAPNSGAVYVFTRTNGVWTQQAYIKASNTDANDFFGRSVALSADTLAVGAEGEASSATGVNGNQADNSAPNSGAVYVFTRTNGVWTQQAYLKASNTDAGDTFGQYEIALEGDTLAVGAPGESSSATGVNGNQADNSAPNSGAVYVFTRTNGVWTQQAYLKASNTGAGDVFGESQALSGDTLAVGAQGEASSATGVNGNQADNSAPGSGAVYVFTRTNGLWTQQAYVKASNTDAADRFAESLTLSGDTLVVQAENEASSATGVNGNQADNSVPGSGAVYVFTRTNGVWAQQAYLKASNTNAGDNFGEDVRLSGNTLAVNANYEASNATGVNGNQSDNSAPSSGATYVFQQ